MTTNNDLDLLIANTILQHLREGKTEEEAYIELENLTGNNKEEIKNHWLHNLSKNYQKAIELAKKIGKLQKKPRNSSSSFSNEETTNVATFSGTLVNKTKEDNENKRIRSDAWTPEQDELLAKTVLEHIRTGSTQMRAFEEVGDKLNRTTAAVGFRWNAEVRKRYENEIQEAKRIRIEKKKQFPSLTTVKSSAKSVEMQKEISNTEITIDHVISFILHLSQKANQTPTEDVSLKEKYDQLKQDYEELEMRYRRLKEDYDLITSIIDKTREFSNNHKRMA